MPTAVTLLPLGERRWTLHPRTSGTLLQSLWRHRWTCNALCPRPPLRRCCSTVVTMAASRQCHGWRTVRPAASLPRSCARVAYAAAPRMPTSASTWWPSLAPRALAKRMWSWRMLVQLLELAIATTTMMTMMRISQCSHPLPHRRCPLPHQHRAPQHQRGHPPWYCRHQPRPLSAMPPLLPHWLPPLHAQRAAS